MNQFETEKEGIEPIATEKAISAADIDLVEVARVTGGKISFDGNNQPHVSWGENNYSSLEWRQEYDGITPIEGEETLWLWRGEWGGGDMELYGLVMGKDFVAFVDSNDGKMYDQKDGELAAEIISGGKVQKPIIAPEGVFNPAFVKAREIAHKNIEACRASHS
jgi:hypothetical protein